MPRRSSSDNICCLREMIACYTRYFSIVCAAKWSLWHATPDVVGQCMLSKGDDDIPPPMLFDNMCFARDMISCHTQCSPIMCDVQERWSTQCPMSPDSVCSPRVLMAYNAQRRPTVCAAEEPFLHAKRDIVRQCVLPKSDDCMWCSTLSSHVCCPRTIWSFQRPTLFDRVFCLLNLV